MKRLTGLSILIIAIGFICNKIVIFANGGMPVPYFYFKAVPNPANVPILSTTKFVLLADIFTVAKTYWNICFSIGDILMVAGLLVIAVVLVRWLLQNKGTVTSPLEMP